MFTIRSWFRKALPHSGFVVSFFVSLSSVLLWRRLLLLLLGANILSAACGRQAVTRRLSPSLSGDGVEQGHGDSLLRLLESCYQVPDFPEISFLHTRSGLKQKKRNFSFFFKEKKGIKRLKRIQRLHLNIKPHRGK